MGTPTNTCRLDSKYSALHAAKLKVAALFALIITAFGVLHSTHDFYAL